jgi:flagellar biosynthesis protein FlhG
MGHASLGRVRVLGASRWRLPIGERGPRLIAVGAAMSGMGKSVVASNLAVAVADLGANVILVDLDLAAPSLHRLFRIARPMPGLQAWFDGEAATLDTALTATGIRKLYLVAGLSRPPRRPLDPARKRDLCGQLQRMGGDIVIVNVGAANRDDVFEFTADGGLCLLVTGSDRTALETTFGLLEGASRRAGSRYGGDARHKLAQFRGCLVGNRVRTNAEAESLHAFSRLVQERLGMPLPVVGCVRESHRVSQGLATRRPLLARGGVDENVRAFHHMAELLMVEGTPLPADDEEPCDLGGDAPILIPEGTRLEGLGRYLRKHPRYVVDWAARLELPHDQSGTLGGSRAPRDGLGPAEPSLPRRVHDARVLDVSATGASVAVSGTVTPGDEGLLRLHQLPGQPELRVVVKHVLADLRRAGVAFVEPGELAARLVTAAGG